jgi:hypothetical protein
MCGGCNNKRAAAEYTVAEFAVHGDGDGPSTSGHLRRPRPADSPSPPTAPAADDAFPFFASPPPAVEPLVTRGSWLRARPPLCRPQPAAALAHRRSAGEEKSEEEKKKSEEEEKKTSMKLTYGPHIFSLIFFLLTRMGRNHPCILPWDLECTVCVSLGVDISGFVVRGRQISLLS